jgi:hypothetical protein
MKWSARNRRCFIHLVLKRLCYINYGMTADLHDNNFGLSARIRILSPVLSSRYGFMQGQYHSGMLSGRSRDVVTHGCCHEVVLSCRVTVMNRHYMMQAAVIHGCCHAELRHLTEPKGEWTLDSRYMGEGSVGRTAVSRPQFIYLPKYGL